MRRIALWEARHPKTVLLFALLLLIPSVFGMINTRINYDVLTYLPDSIDTIKGQDILLEIDTQGALSVMEKCPDGIFIFLLPPSMAELERRIKGRGSETPESLEKRLGAARQEIQVGRKYSYVVVNTTVKMAVKRIQAILDAEHSRVERNDELFEI